MRPFLKHRTAFGFCWLLVLQFVLLGTDVGAQGVQIRLAEDASLQVEAHWQPDADSWLKLYRNSQYAELFDFKPAHPTKEYGAEAFKAFLPPSVDLDGNHAPLKVGDVWAYKVRDVLPFLQQLHPDATVDLSGQRGSFACLRALSPRYAEIVFRCHADFDLRMPMEAETLLEQTEELLEQTEELSKLEVSLTPLEETLESLKAELAETEKLRQELRAEIEKLGEQSGVLSDTLMSLEKVAATPDAQKSEFTELKQEILKLSAVISALNMSLKSHAVSLTDRLTTLEKKLENHFSTLNVEIENRFTALNVKLENEFDKLRTALRHQSVTLTQRLDTLDTRVTELNTTHAYNTGVYFTPNQFTGRLLIDRDTGAIQAFSLGIPAHPGNATLFAFGGVDTVSVQRMELVGKGTIDQSEITWTTAITAGEADEKLRLQFLAKQFRPRNYSGFQK